jgi:hypothetical protein
MRLSHPSRRDFLGLCGALLAGLAAAGVPAASLARSGEAKGKGRGPKGFKIYRRSVRGRRASNALELDTATSAS